MLPSGVQVIVRDWLNANHIVLTGRHGTVLIDSGYGRDTAQTLDRVSVALAGRPLDCSRARAACSLARVTRCT